MDKCYPAPQSRAANDLGYTIANMTSIQRIGFAGFTATVFFRDTVRSPLERKPAL